MFSQAITSNSAFGTPTQHKNVDLTSWSQDDLMNKFEKCISASRLNEGYCAGLVHAFLHTEQYKTGAGQTMLSNFAACKPDHDSLYLLQAEQLLRKIQDNEEVNTRKILLGPKDLENISIKNTEDMLTRLPERSYVFKLLVIDPESKNTFGHDVAVIKKESGTLDVFDPSFGLKLNLQPHEFNNKILDPYLAGAKLNAVTLFDVVRRDRPNHIEENLESSLGLLNLKRSP